MSLSDDLASQVAEIFDSQWSKREGRIVPEPDDLSLVGNDAVELKPATVLYADLDGSTSMVDNYPWWKCAEVYKAYLHCAGKVIKEEGGAITSYDGDRVMAIFIGDSQSTSATRCALKINYVVREIINPSFKRKYGAESFQIKQVIGIDRSDIRATRTGVRGDNDIVWVGRAANYAAKLTTLSADYSTRVTKAVYDRLSENVKMGGNPEQSMWEKATWGEMEIYRSSWQWCI